MRRKIAACLLAATFLAIPICNALPQGVVYADQESDLKSGVSTLKGKLASIRDEVSSLKQKKSEIDAELKELEAAGKAKQEEYDQVVAEMEAATKVMEEAVAASEAAMENVRVQQSAYETRLTTMFQYRNRSTLEILLASDSIEGFFTNMRLMAYVADADNQLLENLRTAQEEAAQKQAEAEKTVEEYKQFMAEKEAELEKLKEGISLAKQKAEEIRKAVVVGEQQEAEVRNHLNAEEARLKAFYEEQARKAREAEEARRRAEEAARRKAAEEAKKNKDNGGNQSGNTGGSPELPPPATGGKLLNPLWGFHYVTSPYGPRVHPITGAKDGFHYGTDFNANFGEPIRAAKAGTVVIADKSYQGQNYTSHKSGYGNYVTIDHGDGTSTTYAHMKYVETSVGAHVEAGSLIGRVGSTGASTGSHLHFEYAIYGKTVNSYNYIRNLSE